MGCKNFRDPKPSSRRSSIAPSIEEMITKLYKLKIIGFNTNLAIDNERSLIRVSELLKNFILHQKVNTLRDVIHIIFLLINMVESVLDIREQYNLKFMIFNFDKVYYDRVKDKLVLNDFSITKNYKFNTIIVDSFVMNKRLKFSLQPYLYRDTVCEYYIGQNLCNDYSYEKSVTFYSFMFINFFKCIFAPTNNDLVYERFRKSIVYNINDILKRNRDMNFESVKNIFVDALVCNETLNDVINSFMTDETGAETDSRTTTSELYVSSFN
jgi:hypothetical protein